MTRQTFDEDMVCLGSARPRLGLDQRNHCADVLLAHALAQGLPEAGRSGIVRRTLGVSDLALWRDGLGRWACFVPEGTSL